MLSLDQIQLLAQKYQTTQLNIRREYLQHLFLNSFYQLPETGTILFKGGTALKIIYRSPRFSEDLDFSAPTLPIYTLETALEQTLANIQQQNVSVNLQEAKTTSGGYLAIIAFPDSSEMITLSLEISLRQSHLIPQATTIVNDFIPSYTLVALSQEQLVTEKIAALLDRHKPRDFFDLYFILRANLLPSAQKSVLHQVSPLLAKSQLNFATELKLFLPKSHWPIIKDFKTTLNAEIGKHV